MNRVVDYVLPAAAMVSCLLLSGAARAGAAAPDCVDAPVTAVADGVYVRQGRHAVVFEGSGIANIGFVVGRRCVAVIDTGGSAREGAELLCAVRKLTTLPICYVINTHVHPDHLLGNSAFRKTGAAFVGHRNLPRDLSLLGQTYLQRASAAQGRVLGPDYLVPPDRLVEDGLLLELGGRTLLLQAYDRAHTTSDVTILDDATDTLWSGDLVFLEHVPVLAGSVNGWLRALEALETLSAARVVPGHGPADGPWPGSAAGTRRYLALLRQEIRQWLRDGGDLWDAQRRLGISERDSWEMFDRYHQRNIANAFAELEWE
jgi:quinoprotein relay system zinc metallohydrolase 2